MRTGYTDAADLIAALEREYPSVSVNWEGILAHQYRRAIPKPRTAVDVGAHEGVHTAQLVKWAESVVCFEPIPELAAQLRQKFSNLSVTVHEVALSNSTGSASFQINCEVPSESGLRIRTDADMRGFKSFVTVPTTVNQLDNYALDHVDFVKIDCEGAELSVLEGGKATIACCRPLLSLEYGWAGYNAYGLTKPSLWEWSRLQGYAVADLFGYLLNDPEIYDQCVDRYYWDFFLIPNERLSDIGERLRGGGRDVLSEFWKFRV
jgi:FkbM family methyltransferase